MTRERILIIEDQREFQIILQAMLSPQYETDCASDLAEAMEKVRSVRFDLILIDVVLGEDDGYEVCEQIRKETASFDSPVIFVTSAEGSLAKTRGFASGANDFVNKPVHKEELLARIQANIHRPHVGKKKSAATIKLADLEVETASQRVFQIGPQGKVGVDLTRREYSLLLYFLQNEEKVLLRSQILDAVWGTGIHITDRTIDTHVSKLRKKIPCLAEALESVHGTGYRLSRTSPAKAA